MRKLLTSIALATTLALGATAAEAASIEQMAGQMILIGFKGDGVGDASIKTLIGEIAKGQIGGVMYLKTNVTTLAAVKAMNAACASGDFNRILNASASSSIRRMISSGAPRISRRDISTPCAGSAAMRCAAASAVASVSPGSHSTLTMPASLASAAIKG